MRYFHKTNNKFFCPSINLDKVWSLLSEQSRAKYLDTPTDKAPVIDVGQAGYYKVLGKGHLPKRPVIIKAKFFSKVAEKRIKVVGGACVLTS
ncbi:60S ribosomal protein L27a [Biomphalaria glabrata]|nr:60S ribosomal protein L27a-like [Biomphalaria glabrata]